MKKVIAHINEREKTLRKGVETTGQKFGEI